LVSASSPSHQVLGSKPSLCRISAGVRLCFGYSLPQTPLVWEPLALGSPPPMGLQKALLSQMSENQKANRDRAICTTEEKVVCRLRLVLNFYKWFSCISEYECCNLGWELMLNYFCFCRVKATIWILVGVVIYLVKTTIWSDGCSKLNSVAHMVNFCYSDGCCYWPECLRSEQRERLSEFFISEMKIYLHFIWMKI
jgi:hypothetical protein